MAEVERLAPAPGVDHPDVIMSELSTRQRDLSAFHPDVVNFVGDLSRSLRRHPETQAHPALGALAYWFRPSNIERLRIDYDRLDADADRTRVPRGVAFHIPPTNVATLFVYSWLLSALVGNANVIRLSLSVDTSGPLLDTINTCIGRHTTIAATTAIVRYDHEEVVTASFSQADVRVIWGGDEAVQRIKAIPSAPATIDLAFPARHSLTVLDASAVLAEANLDSLAGRFFNDAYWFDQLGCSSPRLIVWRGDPSASERAANRFRTALIAELRRRTHVVTPSTALSKLTYAANAAANGTVQRIDWESNELTIGDMGCLDRVDRDGPGGGFFYQASVSRLDELVPHIRRSDQTLGHFGIAPGELRDLARALGSRGIDRIVPIGEALTFDRHWDGLDLFAAFTRAVTVRGA
jgi:hypothetical protein